MAEISPIAGGGPWDQAVRTVDRYTDIASLQGGLSKYNCTGGQPVPHDVEIGAS